MGMSTKGILRKNITITDIKDCLTNKYGIVKVESTLTDYHYIIGFWDGKYTRNFSVFIDYYALNDYGIDGILIDLYCFDNSVEIVTYLCEQFGGYIMENDCAEDCEFKPINIELFEQNIGIELSPKEKFKNKVVSKVGYKHLSDVMELLEEYILLEKIVI
jgi:hypothetical protein